MLRNGRDAGGDHDRVECGELKTSANRKQTQKEAAKKRPQTWKPGQSGNPAGSPKRGESWAEIIKRVGNLTPSEAAKASLELAQQLLKIGDGVTLKEAVVLRVYGALLFDPNPGLLNAFMNRVEGMPTQTVNIDTSKLLTDKLTELGLTYSDISNDPLALELFRQVGINLANTETAGSDSGGEAGE